MHFKITPPYVTFQGPPGKIGPEGKAGLQGRS